MSARHCVAVLLLAVAGPAGALACGPGARGGAPAGGVPDGEGAPAQPAGVREELENARVYDAKGMSHPCPPAAQDCPPVARDNAFLDRCRLTGHQVRQCGCEARCAGNVARQLQHYDAAGKVQECVPATDGCDPPPAGAAFQDACTERGHRLAVCGCAWLCSGDPTRAR